MKKLFLLLSAGVFALSVNAQQSSSIMLTHSGGLSAARSLSQAHVTTRPIKAAHHSANKTTINGGGGWFNYFDQLATSAGIQYYFNTYQDSTLLDDANGNYLFFHGLGESFDPTDSAYTQYGQQNPDLTTILPIVVGSHDAYTIDSFYLNGKYMRNENFTDTLMVELAVSGGTSNGTVNLQFVDATPTGYTITADGKPRFADATYNGDSSSGPISPVVAPYNQLSDSITAPIWRGSMVLDAAAFADTDMTSGNGTFQFTITPPLSVPAGQKVVAFAHFKSGHTYPFGTTIENANYFHFLAGDPVSTGVFPPQSSSNTSIGYSGSYQAGLIADDQNTYNDTSFAFEGHNILIPNSAYNEPPGWDAADFGFYLNCTTCAPSSVATVKNIVSSINAYPSPANTALYVPFTLSATADVNVTVTNTLGQVVKSEAMGNVASGKASFNTSDLAGGIYFYTVNAGGQRSTGRILIAH